MWPPTPPWRKPAQPCGQRHRALSHPGNCPVPAAHNGQEGAFTPHPSLSLFLSDMHAFRLVPSLSKVSLHLSAPAKLGKSLWATGRPLPFIEQLKPFGLNEYRGEEKPPQLQDSQGQLTSLERSSDKLRHSATDIQYPTSTLSPTSQSQPPAQGS